MGCARNGVRGIVLNHIRSGRSPRVKISTSSDFHRDHPARCFRSRDDFRRPRRVKTKRYGSEPGGVLRTVNGRYFGGDAGLDHNRSQLRRRPTMKSGQAKKVRQEQGLGYSPFPYKSRRACLSWGGTDSVGSRRDASGRAIRSFVDGGRERTVLRRRRWA